MFGDRKINPVSSRLKVNISVLGVPGILAGNLFSWFLQPLCWMFSVILWEHTWEGVALRFESKRDLGGEREGRLSSFFVGAFLHLLAGDFTESNEKLLKNWWRERNWMYLELGFLLRLLHLIQVPKNPLRGFVLLTYISSPCPRDCWPFSSCQPAASTTLNLGPCYKTGTTLDSNISEFDS